MLLKSLQDFNKQVLRLVKIEDFKSIDFNKQGTIAC